MYKFLGGLQRCIEHALQVLYNKEYCTSFGDVTVFTWEQSWADTSLGFGGIGGQMISSAPTVVIIDKHYTEAVVFHGFRFAYKVSCNRKFMELFAKQNLPGANEKYKLSE